MISTNLETRKDIIKAIRNSKTIEEAENIYDLAEELFLINSEVNEAINARIDLHNAKQEQS